MSRCGFCGRRALLAAARRLPALLRGLRREWRDDDEPAAAAAPWDDVHIYPLGDLADHHIEGDCPCGPTVEPVPRGDGSYGWLVVHHSLDGRELTEDR